MLGVVIILTIKISDNTSPFSHFVRLLSWVALSMDLGRWLMQTLGMLVGLLERLTCMSGRYCSFPALEHLLILYGYHWNIYIYISKVQIPLLHAAALLDQVTSNIKLAHLNIQLINFVNQLLWIMTLGGVPIFHIDFMLEHCRLSWSVVLQWSRQPMPWSN